MEFTKGRADEALKLHSISLSVDEYNMMGSAKPWEWTSIIVGAIEHRSSKVHKFNRGAVCKGEFATLNRPMQSIDEWQRVLQGFNWPVQGSNGSNAAQLSQP